MDKTCIEYLLIPPTWQHVSLKVEFKKASPLVRGGFCSSCNERKMVCTSRGVTFDG